VHPLCDIVVAQALSVVSGLDFKNLIALISAEDVEVNTDTVGVLSRKAVFNVSFIDVLNTVITVSFCQFIALSGLDLLQSHFAQSAHCAHTLHGPLG
jgi:hypothetical protein